MSFDSAVEPIHHTTAPVTVSIAIVCCLLAENTVIGRASEATLSLSPLRFAVYVGIIVRATNP